MAAAGETSGPGAAVADRGRLRDRPYALTAPAITSRTRPTTIHGTTAGGAATLSTDRSAPALAACPETAPPADPAPAGAAGAP